MFSATTTTSELEAVNIMLSMIGQNPVPSLNAAAQLVTVQNALMVLRDTTRRTCTSSYNFNTLMAVEMTPGIGHKRIDLEPECVRVRVHRHAPGMHGVKIALKGRNDDGTVSVYDRKRNTFEWERPLVLDKVLLMPFGNLPEAIRQFVTVTAGMVFVGRYPTSEQRWRFSQAEAAAAKLALDEHEIEEANPNMLRDSASVFEAWADVD